MSITSELNDVKTEFDNAQVTIEIVSKFRIHAQTTNKIRSFVQGIVDSGDINLVPTDTRTALTTYFTELKTFIDTIEADADVMEVLTWIP